ncbi:hypothetical protein Moror_17035, partial [Moniliophthora roreri MCA 2997]
PCIILILSECGLKSGSGLLDHGEPFSSAWRHSIALKDQILTTSGYYITFFWTKSIRTVKPFRRNGILIQFQEKAII